MLCPCHDLIRDCSTSIEIPEDSAAYNHLNSGTLTAGDLYCSDGWVDIQVNGFGGHNFSVENLEPNAVLAVTRLLRREGVTQWCPTLITGSHERMAASIGAILEAVGRYEEVKASIIGIHLEGPYISPLDGVRGVHPPELIRPPDWDEFTCWQKKAKGLIRIITLAPEVEGALQFIRRTAEAGVVVAIGHSLASGEQIAAAVAAGARLSTHLGNGITAHLHRHKNPIWEQLAEDALYASAVFDGFHLTQAVMRVFHRVKGARRLILTSDASPLARMAPGVYETTIGGKVELCANGRLAMYGSQEYLAGSACSVKDCIEVAVRMAGCTLREAVAMASETPRQLMGIPDTSARTFFAWDQNECKATVIAVQDGDKLPHFLDT